MRDQRERHCEGGRLADQRDVIPIGRRGSRARGIEARSRTDAMANHLPRCFQAPEMIEHNPPGKHRKLSEPTCVTPGRETDGVEHGLSSPDAHPAHVA